MDNQEKMLALVDEYRQSGKTAKTFCIEKGIGMPKFNYWVRKRKLGASSGFVRVGGSNLQTMDVPVQLVYPNGVRLRLTTVDPALITACLSFIDA